MIAAVPTEMLASPITEFRVKDFCPDEDGLLAPMSLFHVKGWSRSMAAIACMLHGYTMPEAFTAPFSAVDSITWL